MKRKRSRSARVKIGRVRYAKSNGKGRQPSVYRIIYLVTGTDDLKLFYLGIPSKSLDAFRKGKYNIDVHGCQQLQTSPHLLVSTKWFVYGKPAVIGSTIYTLAKEKVFFPSKVDLELLTLNLESQLKEWKPLLPLPPFEVKVTSQSVLASLRGCLYVLGAYPAFGAIFDPKTRIWSKLEASNGVNLNSVDVTFIASLGDSVGKILVHDMEDAGFGFRTFIRLYDVYSNHCPTFDGELLAHVNSLETLDRPIVVSEDGKNSLLYFINNSGFIYAFDWETMALFKGPVLGFEEAGLMSCCASCTSFLHFGHGLFCLCYSTHHCTDCGGRTCLHYLFIRVNKLDASLDAYVVGCFKDFIDDYYRPYGAFFV